MLKTIQEQKLTSLTAKQQGKQHQCPGLLSQRAQEPINMEVTLFGTTLLRACICKVIQLAVQCICPDLVLLQLRCEIASTRHSESAVEIEY